MRYYFSAFLLTTIGFILVLSAIFYKEESYQRDATLNQSQLLLHKGHLLLKDEYAAVSQDLLMISETIQDYSRKGLSQAFAPRLVSFMENKPLYDQLRVINASAMERMRINRVNAKTVIVPQNELQNKAHRYYFLETKRLKRNEIYISAVDLNIENGKVEEPYKPTFRVATPLFDENHNQIGIIVINVLAESIFTKIKAYVKREGFEPLIANKNGEWLLAPEHERAFLFMFGIKRNQVQESCPKLWEELKYHESGFISQGGKNFTYLKFSPTESIQRMGFKSLATPSASLAKSLGDPSLEELLFISYDDEIIFAERDRNISKGMPYFIFVYILTTLLALYVVKLFISRLVYSKDLMLAEHFFKYSDDGVVITDPQTHILRVNERYCTITGFKEGELIGQKSNIISSGLTPPEVYADLWRELSLNGYWEGELSDRRANGSLYIQHLRIIVIKNDRGEVTNYVGITSDITERKNSQEKIRKLAFEDALTGLPNRTLLYDRLEQSINISKRMHTEVALLFIDLDDFKIINDLHGHNLGDQYLINVAGRLKSSIRSNDTIARIGADEFMIVLQNYDKEYIIQSATRILGLLQSKVDIEGHKFS
ncbi:MAG: diguanylate cyclase, partial [Epsilonproteobacteria bacterium]|nr:diguanylate cyclase [Campylobacterota bacterium]